MFEYTSGPRKARVVIVGEAWGAEEAAASKPFAGQSGRELFRMLLQAWKLSPEKLKEALAARSQKQWLSLREIWLREVGVLLTNIVHFRPENNDFTKLLYSNKEVKETKKSPLAPYDIYPTTLLSLGIAELWMLIEAVDPELIIAAGNWPLHILSPHCTVKTDEGFKLPTGIGSWRGSQTYSRPSPSGKVYQLLPIIHPAAILRDWSQRHVTVHDLRARAGRLLNGSTRWQAPQTNDIWRPTFAEVQRLVDTWREALSNGEFWLCCDIETYQRKFITCIGITDNQTALCIPIFYFNERQQSISYWVPDQEIIIWKWLKELLEHPNCRVIGQHFIYDMQALHRYHNINVTISGDTEIAHHVLFPGTDKALHNLAALYCDHYCYWKDESEEWAVNEISAEQLWQYNCKDIRKTYEAWETLSVALQQQGMVEIYQDRINQWQLAKAITLNGTACDEALRANMSNDIKWEINRVESWLLGAVPESARYTAAGKPWFTSSQATMRLLYSYLGLKPILHKKTKRPTSNDEAINELAEDEENQWLLPLLGRLSELRSAYVFKRNFLDSPLDPWNRMVTQINVAQPETFRWSSSANGFDEGGNMQNLPTNPED